jgi:hypothetical protein
MKTLITYRQRVEARRIAQRRHVAAIYFGLMAVAAGGIILATFILIGATP